MKLYNQLLMDHYHNPRNYHRLKFPDFNSLAFNPLCGDKIFLDIIMSGKLIMEIGFQGEGCIISLATASLLFEGITHQTMESLALLTERNVLDLIKLELGLNRLKCALLPLEALKMIIEKYLSTVSNYA